MGRILFAVSVAALIFVCTSVGAYAGFYLSFNWYAIVEPIVYPCPYPGNAGTCMQDPNEPPPEAPVWFYGYPAMDPTHIHDQPPRACVFDFLYHDPLPPGSLRGGQQ